MGGITSAPETNGDGFVHVRRRADAKTEPLQIELDEGRHHDLLKHDYSPGQVAAFACGECGQCFEATFVASEKLGVRIAL